MSAVVAVPSTAVAVPSAAVAVPSIVAASLSAVVVVPSAVAAIPSVVSASMSAVIAIPSVVSASMSAVIAIPSVVSASMSAVAAIPSVVSASMSAVVAVPSVVSVSMSAVVAAPSVIAALPSVVSASMSVVVALLSVVSASSRPVAALPSLVSASLSAIAAFPNAVAPSLRVSPAVLPLTPVSSPAVPEATPFASAPTPLTDARSRHIVAAFKCYTPPMPQRSVSPDLVLSLSPPILRALLHAFGAPRGTSANAPLLTVARALFAARAPSKLQRALDEIARFASEPGRRAILEAALACGEPRADQWRTLPAADLAATLVTERATSRDKASARAAKRLLSLATLRLERRLPERASYELLAPGPAPDAKALRALLARSLGDATLDVWTHVGDDGSIEIAVFVCGPAAHALLPPTSKGSAPVREVLRPLAVDRLRVSPDGARVRVAPAAPEGLVRYASILGLSLGPSLTLRPFHAMTPAMFARSALPEGVRSVVVIAVRWREPNGTRHETRAFDVTASAPPTPGGYIDRVTLRVDVEGAARPVDVFLEVPYRFEISDLAHEETVRALLAHAGVFAPGATPDDAWSLAPFVHGDWRWRAVLGHDAVDRMLQGGLLARVRTPHVATEELRMLGTTYVVRTVPGEPSLEYALSEDPSFPARLVGPDDRVALRLDVAQLAAAMQRTLGATGAAGRILDGVLDLGEVAIGAGKLRFFYFAAAPAPGWAAVLHRACGVAATPVLLVPRGRKAGSEMLALDLDIAEQLGAAPLAHVVLLAAEALGVETQLEPWRHAREDVVIDRAKELVWVRGVLVRKLSDRAYRLLERLAREPGRTLAARELGGLLSRSGYPDVAARRAKLDLERQVRACLEEAGADSAIAGRILVAEARRGYRLAVSVKVV